MSPSFSLLLIFSLLILPQPLALKGLLLNCGSPTPFHSPATNLTFLPDSPFISAGTPQTLTLTRPNLLPLLSTFRSFPSNPSTKFCYSLPTLRHSRYLLRTTYFYGGGLADPPVFDQVVDGVVWSVVNTTGDYRAGMASSYEGVFLARGKSMSVCVAGNEYTYSDMFINVVEMVVLEDSVYNGTDFRRNAMGLVARSRFGYDGPIVGYPDDRLNRFWQPFMGNMQAIGRTEDISISGIWNLPPLNVFSTAITADHANPIRLQWPPISLPNSAYYVALYFADTSGTSRIFDVFLNEYSFYDNLKVTSSGLAVFGTQWNLSGLTKITLSPLSSAPPVINAGEIFGIFPLGGLTITRDVITLNRIKKSIQNPPVGWNGDPCLPREYSWSGVTCSEGSRIRVIALNLSSLGLSGSLSPSIANLTALTYISFANNNFSGHIPDNNFSGHIPDLSQLRMLEKLHLQDNQLTGAIPESLGNIKNLRELFLYNNDLTGEVPVKLSRKPGLTIRV